MSDAHDAPHSPRADHAVPSAPAAPSGAVAPSVRVVRHGPARPGAPVLVCFPHAGGGASAFRRWPGALPDGAELELWAVQPPGREERADEPCLTDFGELLAATAASVGEVVAGRPYAFFGHSVGSVLAFELAREARRRGERLPEALAVSAFPAPHTLVPHALDGIPDKAILDFLSGLSYAFADGQAPPPRLVEEFLPVLRADFSAVSSYAFADEAPLPCPLHVFCGSVDRFVRPAELHKWDAYTDGEFALHVLRGGHFYLNQHAAGILEILGTHLTAHSLTQEV
ncbi:alpha/beta fold hydrolase [Streptomyces albiaxialis]|uniref:Alpha/beta fold hydrolase n=1 Tax=Streptomyces albiaxialis TaxID=329523 RepID=A0ABN2W5U3_9ACTN